MKKKKLKMDNERKIVIYSITDTEFLKNIYPILKPDCFNSPYAKYIITWVLEYYTEYKEAPKKNIQEIYYTKKDFIRDEEDVEIIGKFLSRLNKFALDIQNHNYTLQQAENWIRLRTLDLLKDDLEDCVYSKDFIRAENIVAQFRAAKRIETNTADILNDEKEIIQAYNREEQHLFTFPGVLGKVVGAFNRTDFISFIGFMGKGKTWWLWFLARTAMANGLKVAFFTLEMPKEQMIRRAWESLTGKPREDMEIMIPKYKYDEDEEKYFVTTNFEQRKGLSTEREAIIKEQKKVKRYFRGGQLKIKSFPAYQATVEDLFQAFDHLVNYEDFEADVLLVDYADIVKPSSNQDYRHQLDAIWKKLRGFAEDRYKLVATATQSTRDGSKRDVKEGDIAEDIRKLAHVTKMISLNQTSDEYEKGIMRISQLKEREGKRNFKQAAVLQCLDIGAVCLDSRYVNDIVIGE